MTLGIQFNGDKLKEIASASQSETESMTHLTRELRGDSKLIKVLTFTAIIYTPASLIAVSALSINNICLS
jgi:hypothetical protein